MYKKGNHSKWSHVHLTEHYPARNEGKATDHKIEVARNRGKLRKEEKKMLPQRKQHRRNSSLQSKGISYRNILSDNVSEDEVKSANLCEEDSDNNDGDCDLTVMLSVSAMSQEF
jgi:hypothetical protein